MKIEIDFDADQVSEIVRQDLIDYYYIAAEMEDDDELNNAFIKVIDYYSNREQFQEFLNAIRKNNSEIEQSSRCSTFKTKGRYDL